MTSKYRLSKGCCQRTIAYTLLIAILLPIMVSPVTSAPFAEHIRAWYPEEDLGFRVEGHMTYPSDSWYYNQPMMIRFNITVELPEESTLEFNLTRMYIFVYFYDDYFTYPLLDNSSLISINTNESTLVYSLEQEFTVNQTVCSQNFVIDEYGDSAVLGFVIFFDSYFESSTRTTITTQRPLFSYRLDEVASGYYPDYPQDNSDYIHVEVFQPLPLYLLYLVLIVVIVGGGTLAVFFFERWISKIPDSLEEISTTEEVDLVELLQEEESQTLERKPHLFWNEGKQERDKNFEFDVVEVIIGYMNSNDAVVIIGQTDKKEIIGVESEFPHLRAKKKNQEGYEFKIRDMLSKHATLKQAANSLISIEFIEKDNHQICFIKISRSHEPVWFTWENDKHFPVRYGKRTQKLDPQEQEKYIRRYFRR